MLLNEAATRRKKSEQARMNRPNRVSQSGKRGCRQTLIPPTEFKNNVLGVGRISAQRAIRRSIGECRGSAVGLRCKHLIRIWIRSSKQASTIKQSRQRPYIRPLGGTSTVPGLDESPHAPARNRPIGLVGPWISRRIGGVGLTCCSSVGAADSGRGQRHQP